MNVMKSELFFARYSDDEAELLAGQFGIRRGSFPTRYLGPILNPTKLSLPMLIPFIEQITSKLNS